ncbi:winged helix-turn-helix domain-containing protein [Longispora sp. NPDC051575]|uniref:ArsR/SmtB family transcription factor n=1 Tax=Longispora sp. NPDC051575 TaxID=3154943 RepID=UPI00341D1D52
MTSPVHIDDPKVMRALAHPARLAILTRLHQHGPTTATECAEVTGLSPSATSYHLRALADYGLIEKAESRGDGRETVWQSKSTHMHVHQDTPESRTAGRHLLKAWLARQDQALYDWMDQEQEQSEDWRDVVRVDNVRVTVNPERLVELMERVHVLLEEYRDTGDDNARKVSISLRAVPLL